MAHDDQQSKQKGFFWTLFAWCSVCVSVLMLGGFVAFHRAESDRARLAAEMCFLALREAPDAVRNLPQIVEKRSNCAIVGSRRRSIVDMIFRHGGFEDKEYWIAYADLKLELAATHSGAGVKAQ